MGWMEGGYGMGYGVGIEWVWYRVGMISRDAWSV